MARALLIVLTTFWLTMNILLWRSEYGGHPGLGSAVPAHVVWQKILTAPDSSSLTILRRGKKIGFCHWVTSVGEDLAKMSSNDTPPEGMVRKIVNYRIELDGNVMSGEMPERVRFDSHLSLGGDGKWQDFNLRVNWRPTSLEIRSSEVAQTVHLRWQDDTGRFDRVFKFSEFENPQELVQEFGGPFASSLLSGLGLPSVQAKTNTWGLQWEAHNESLKLGHSSARVYRLQAHILDRFAVIIFVSRVGEILRVEMPEGITLINDQLGGN